MDAIVWARAGAWFGRGRPGRGRGRRGRHGPAFAMLSLLVVSSLVAGCTPRDPLEFSPTTLPDGAVGTPYAVTVTVTHEATPVGGVSVQEGSLPPGIDVVLNEGHDNTFQIGGTPTKAGTFSFTVYVWCYGTNVSGQTATQPYTLVVK